MQVPAHSSSIGFAGLGVRHEPQSCHLRLPLRGKCSSLRRSDSLHEGCHQRPSPPLFYCVETPTREQPRQLRAELGMSPYPKFLYKALGAQNISALAIGSRHSTVPARRARALAIQITGSDGLNIRHYLRRQAARHASQPAIKERQVARWFRLEPWPRPQPGLGSKALARSGARLKPGISSKPEIQTVVHQS